MKNTRIRLSVRRFTLPGSHVSGFSTALKLIFSGSYTGLNACIAANGGAYFRMNRSISDSFHPGRDGYFRFSGLGNTTTCTPPSSPASGMQHAFSISGKRSSIISS